MSTPIFTGAAVALVTPMTADGSVNYEKLDELIEFQIEGGTDAIVACGTTGEASTLTHEEHINVIRHTVEKVAGRIPVIAGTGSNDTNHGIHLSQEAVKAGADALLVVTPYYNKCTTEGLYRHYKAIAESAEAPIVLYNVPSRTNVNISPDALYRLADIENIVAIKECNLGQVPEILSKVGDRFDFYSGEDGLAVPLASLGGKGVISVVANILPEFMSTMMHAYLNGDVKKARDMQVEIIPMVKAMFCEVNPIPVKEALNILGAGVGPCRLPLCEMSEKNHNYVADVLSKYDTSALTSFFG